MSSAPFSSIPSLIGFRYAVWLIDVICVDWSSARRHRKRISDVDAGSLDLRSLPQQEVRDCQKAAQDQPKKARKRPKGRQQGPKRAPRRAQKRPRTGPRRPWLASGRPKSEHPRMGRQPRPNAIQKQARSGLFWATFWGRSWADNRRKLAPECAPNRGRNVHAEKYPRRARKSARRGVPATPSDAKIIKNDVFYVHCF